LEEIWRIQDYLGQEVVLTEVRREPIVSEHSELVRQLADVRHTLEQPDQVRRDRKFAHRENSYKRKPSGKRWMKVVVHYRPVPPQGTWVGEIVTAYDVEEPEPLEVLLWH
jgi:hypothetical protein